jgi:predicted acylesterase/phospholipase RssA
MWQVARATAAAPTYFEPFEVAAMTPHGGLVDGGVFANNPAMCAYVEANKLHGRANDFLIVSIGTGQYSSPIHYRDAKGWGLALWAKPILNVVFDGVSDTVDHQMRSLCQPGPDRRPRYYRFQCRLDPRCDAMDDTSPENVRRLKEKAEAMIDESDDLLVTLCSHLAERAPVQA